MTVRWDPLKSHWLERIRGISFEEIVRAPLVAVIEHPKRMHQKYLLFEIKNYIWVVPFVKSDDDIFLKTAFPSRVYTKRWIQGEWPEKKKFH